MPIVVIVVMLIVVALIIVIIMIKQKSIDIKPRNYIYNIEYSKIFVLKKS